MFKTGLNLSAPPSGAEAGAVLPGTSLHSWRAHPLHGQDRQWTETNCYVDLWIELLHAMGLAPEAALGFTLTQDFEGDHFTFFKFPLEDLEALFGLRVQELALYESVSAHAMRQIARGQLVLVEVDSFYLPDTRGVSYHSEHTKTTIAINRLDPVARRMEYFHNAGYFAVEGDDCDGVLQALPGQAGALFPYAEFVKMSEKPCGETALRARARALFAHHLGRRPARNPVIAFSNQIARDAAMVADKGEAFFHKYAFNMLRQLGANFELLASHIAWLDAGNAEMAKARIQALRIAELSKSFQFQLARAVARRRFDTLAPGLAPIVEAYDLTFAALDAAEY